MQDVEELFETARKLEAAAENLNSETIAHSLAALDESANSVGRSFSGSWLGYHSHVYYNGFVSKPPGANFSQEWGLKDLSYSSLGSRGDWREYDSETVLAHIYDLAGKPNLDAAHKAADAASEFFDRAKSEIISILESDLADRLDAFLLKLKEELEKIEPLSKNEIVEIWRPKSQIMTRDMIAMGQGTTLPPHVGVLAEIASIRRSFDICKDAAKISKKAASHLERQSRKRNTAARIGTNVFIGHGRSAAWRELKDFIQDRLRLPWDEFNRVPVAGVTNIARLSEMLDAAAIALLVMTAEDEMVDGEVQARLNVVHEAGLFQGRLGFSRAIVLLEEGCAEFSNIQGLGQIRFPKGNIAASFEEVRRVLEREELVSE